MPIQKWEYKRVQPENLANANFYDGIRTNCAFQFVRDERGTNGKKWDWDDIEPWLNKMGEEGWELIQIGPGNSLAFYFKRPKQ